MFSDISRYENISDYLPILNAVLLVDLAGIQMLISGIIQSKKLAKWYKTFRLEAVAADVLIIVIGIVIARFLYSYLFKGFSLFYFVILVVGIQIIHDFGFYVFFKMFPSGKNQMIDLFQEYAKEVGINAVIFDSGMIGLASILASWLASFSTNTNIVLLIFVLYLFPYYISHNFITS
jgi:uncharacterized protein YacL